MNADEPLPIRELSRLTGVNSVTLRAWERRYGLIKPMRTHKGHRLYTQDDVVLVKKIQDWLARGLAIGKVSEFLASGQQDIPDDTHERWQQETGQLLAMLAEMNLNKLESFFHNLLAVYPAALIADELVAPVLNKLEHKLFGNSLKKTLFSSRLGEYLCMLNQRQRQQAKGARLGVVQLVVPTDSLLNSLLQYSLLTYQMRPELIGLISPGEMGLAVNQLHLDGLIIYNDNTTSLAEFYAGLDYIARKVTVPVFVGGALGQVMSGKFPSNVYCINEPGQQGIVNRLCKYFPPAEERSAVHE